MKAEKDVDYLTKIDRLAKEYQSPETQRLIELGKAVEVWLANEQAHGQWEAGYLQRGTRTSTAGMVITSPEELLEWHRAQEVQHGTD